MTSFQPDRNIAQSERRSRERRASAKKVRVVINGVDVAGRVENQSGNGVFLVLDQPIQIKLVSDDGFQTGAIVRVSALAGGESGIGIEFDESDDAATDPEDQGADR